MSRTFRKSLDLDGSIKKRAWDFLQKLMDDPSSPGLHIEPIKGARDPRVRTGRVSDDVRAVMFLVAEQPDKHFVLAAIGKHDPTTALAERIVLTTNPVSGVLEVHEEPQPGAPGQRATEPVTPEPTSPATGPLACFSPAELEAVGISPALAARAVTCPDEDALIAAATGRGIPPWQGDVLVALATGTAVDDVLATLGISVDGTARTVAEAAAPEASAEQVAAALERPGSQMDFVRIETDDELRRVLDGSFAEWRVFLHPEQRRYAYASTSGAYRLSGGAGTGKTVVALHRARHLAATPTARVVLSTFTRTLADNLARDLRALDASVPQVPLARPGVTVRGIDQLALEVLTSIPADLRARVGGELLAGGVLPRPLTDADERQAWADAAVRAGLTDDLARPTFLLSEYRMVVLANDLTAREDYLRITRPGRKTRLSRAGRIAVWAAVEVYRRQCALNRTASFAEIAVLAARCADGAVTDGAARLADHVIVDEAQDLHPGHWRLLRALVEEGPDDLFIAEDGHQRIYGEKVVLSRFGIAVRGRSRRLTLNYRTTAQNLRFALGILQGADSSDLEGEQESTVGYRSAMTGPHPVLRSCQGLTEELDAVAETVRAWLEETDGTGKHTVEPDSVGVLTRSAQQRDLVAQGLRDRGLRAHVVTTQNTGRSDAPRLMTMHRAKGLEFSRVVLFGVDRASLPSQRVLAAQSDDERADAADRERFLLYVAASRARDALVVVWSGEQSPFLSLPDDDQVNVPPAVSFPELWEFALTYDGYGLHGDDVGKIGNDSLDLWKTQGRLPDELDRARCALFFEQRRWHHFGEHPDHGTLRYLAALLGRIREVSGGRVADFHPAV